MIKQKINWSLYQKDIFKDIANGDGNTIIIARAGSAKTSSIVEGSKYIPKGKRALFCAFNKVIKEELKSKLKKNIECLTLHSLGFRSIKSRFSNVELNNRKCWNIVESIIEDPKQNYELINNIYKTVGFVKLTLPNTKSEIEDLIYKYDIDICDIDINVFINYVYTTLEICKNKINVIDFNDMIWFPYIYKLNVGKYDYVFVDEAQDLNKAQIELALSAVSNNGRLIAVLDPAQAIYSWTGADVEVLDNLRNKLKPKELSLPICYRCPKVIVEKAKKFVSDIEPFEKAIEGSIKDISVTEMYRMLKPGVYVISRLNAPLIKHCMHMLRNNIPSNILGRDIGSNLLSLIKKSKKKTILDFIKWLNKWEINEKSKLLNKCPNANTEGITDKAECLHNLCEDIKSIDELKKNIDILFKDTSEKNIILFSSVHRIKGKECDTVFVLADTLRSSSQEELNIQYVAITRTKSELFMVYKSKKTQEIVH